MAQTQPISTEQPRNATLTAAEQVLTVAAQAVAVQVAASLTLAALVWPLLPAAKAVANVADLAIDLGQRLPAPAILQ